MTGFHLMLQLKSLMLLRMGIAQAIMLQTLSGLQEPLNLEEEHITRNTRWICALKIFLK